MTFGINTPKAFIDNCEQSLEHWLLLYSSFGEISNDVFNNLDIVHSFFNSDSRNVNSENSGNNSENNSSEIGLNNSHNEISNNSDNVNENLSVKNSSVNNLSVYRSGNNRSKRKCSKVFNFLFGGKLNNNRKICVITNSNLSANADNTVR
ncbi:hypothetical protein PIROE2DRAFT_4885 [Piromyces sp. E2]|nr:hypothetical protein PIROE2DRAFT_4885 [Piromyces sp. E2]|eukprot:OUM67598.1 hypothetical protein PIROE2DRAFT_4885 [Piromyces sp. E2]